MWTEESRDKLMSPVQRGSQVDKRPPSIPKIHITMATAHPNMEFCANKHHIRVRAGMGTPALGDPTAQETQSSSLHLLIHAEHEAGTRRCSVTGADPMPSGRTCGSSRGMDKPGRGYETG